MLAYKFLADGAVAPFTGRRWPLPEARAPGAWVVARPCDLARYGVHACRVEDLAYRLDDELWLVELEDPVARTPFQVVAARGRLLQRITAWNGASSHEYAAACAWRAPDLAVEGLVRAGSNAEAAALRACIDLPSLEPGRTRWPETPPRRSHAGSPPMSPALRCARAKGGSGRRPSSARTWARRSRGARQVPTRSAPGNRSGWGIGWSCARPARDRGSRRSRCNVRRPALDSRACRASAGLRSSPSSRCALSACLRARTRPAPASLVASAASG